MAWHRFGSQLFEAKRPPSLVRLSESKKAPQELSTRDVRGPTEELELFSRHVALKDHFLLATA